MFLVGVLLNVTKTTRAIAMEYYHRLSETERQDFEEFSDIEIFFCLLVIALKYDQDCAPTMGSAIKIFNTYAPMAYEDLELDRMLSLEVTILQALDWDVYYAYQNDDD
ncbi:hypothetical protein TWF718_001549 [Orbilia javanica]|uniref:Cyclin N-terminal domain-containing protein n=1 Tax=Orbilia javanica TaxID=47235 RepID=A0AAN8RSK0_9PEZI